MISRIRHFAVCLLMMAFAAKAQVPTTDPTQYEYAKELLMTGKNMQALAVLESANISPTAPFYWNSLYLKALANYRSGKFSQARELLLQLLNQPSWDGADEARFLLGQVEFDDKRPAEAIAVLDKVKSNWADQIYALKKDRIKLYEVPALKALYDKFPYDKAVGRTLLGKLYAEEQWIDQMSLIRELEAQHHAKETVAPVEQTPGNYKVALLLPFLEEKIEPTSNSGNFVLDLYEGMLLALEDLAEEGIVIEHFDYDTKRDSLVTQRILENPDLQRMNLIVGPLYANTIPVAQGFCKKYNIPMVNPLSDNSSLLTPQTMLMLPSEKKQAASAKFSAEVLKGTGAYIVYGTAATDLVSADAFKAEFERLGGKVKAKFLFQSSESAYSALLKSFEGISRDPNAIVFVAGSEPSLASSVISLVQSMQPNAKILAPQKWLEMNQLSLARLESVNAHFYCQLLFDESSEQSERFLKEYIANTKVLPSKFSYLGYETMYTFGKALQHSKGDLLGQLPQLPWIQGKLYSKHAYRLDNSNDCVRIVQFVSGKLMVVYSTIE